jgi:hypothetical protein
MQIGLRGLAARSVGQHHPSAAVLGQHRHDVLKEVELLVGRGGKEILTVLILPLGIDLAVVTDDAATLLLAERRIGQHHVESFPAGA